MILVTKRVAVAPFELKLGPNESYGRAASVKATLGAPKAQIRANIMVKLPIHRPGGRYVIRIFTHLRITYQELLRITYYVFHVLAEMPTYRIRVLRISYVLRKGLRIYASRHR